MTAGQPPEKPCVSCTALGLVAILLWATTIAFSRRLTGALGTFTAAAGVYVIAGSAAMAMLAARPGGLAKVFRLPTRYLLVCGSLFVFYTVMLYMAVGLAADSTQAVEVGIVNYLWPSFVIVMSVPLLGRPMRWTLWPAVIIALAGVVLAKLPPDGLDPKAWLASLAHNPLPFVFAFAGALSWGVYSNLSRRWTGQDDANGSPLFLAGSAVVLLTVRAMVSEQSAWSAGVVAELVYMGLLPGMAGYMLYDSAIRKGHIVVVASMAYFIPLLSTLVSCMFLGVPLRATLVLASGLLIVGAVLSNLSVRVTDQPR